MRHIRSALVLVVLFVAAFLGANGFAQAAGPSSPVASEAAARPMSAIPFWPFPWP